MYKRKLSSLPTTAKHSSLELTPKKAPQRGTESCLPLRPHILIPAFVSTGRSARCLVLSNAQAGQWLGCPMKQWPNCKHLFPTIYKGQAKPRFSFYSRSQYWHIWYMISFHQDWQVLTYTMWGWCCHISMHLRCPKNNFLSLSSGAMRWNKCYLPSLQSAGSALTRALAQEPSLL